MNRSSDHLAQTSHHITSVAPIWHFANIPTTNIRQNLQVGNLIKYYVYIIQQLVLKSCLQRTNLGSL